MVDNITHFQESLYKVMADDYFTASVSYQL